MAKEVKVAGGPTAPRPPLALIQGVPRYMKYNWVNQVLRTSQIAAYFRRGLGNFR